jgi:hypothetical protein
VYLQTHFVWYNQPKQYYYHHDSKYIAIRWIFRMHLVCSNINAYLTGPFIYQPPTNYFLKDTCIKRRTLLICHFVLFLLLSLLTTYIYYVIKICKVIAPFNQMLKHFSASCWCDAKMGGCHSSSLTAAMSDIHSSEDHFCPSQPVTAAFNQDIKVQNNPFCANINSLYVGV